MKFFRFNITAVLVFFMFFPSMACSNSPQPINIGLILSKTGIAALDNLAGAKGADLAVKEINDIGGILGRPLKIIEFDNLSTPLGSDSAAKKAVLKGVSAVIGPYRSSHALSAAPILQSACIPMIAPTATAPEVTLVGNYIFRMCFTDNFQGQFLADFARNGLKAQRAAVIINAGEQYSLTLADFFKTGFTRDGGEIVLEEHYSRNAVDFSDILTKINKIRPDICFIPGYSRDSGLFIRQSAKKGIFLQFLGGDAWDDQILDYAGNALEGAYFSTNWHPEITSEKNDHLKKLYFKVYSKTIENNYRIPLTYDAVHILADAIKRSGSTEPSKIQAALARTSGFQGATGTITFDINGDPVNNKAVIMKCVNNKWTHFK